MKFFSKSSYEAEALLCSILGGRAANQRTMAAPTTLSRVTSASAAPIAAPTTFATAASIVVRNEVALTTPYVFPPGCENVYELSTGKTFTHAGASIQETFLYVDNKAEAWKSCQPPGLRKQYNPYNYASNYRKAVCPQSWVAWEVGMSSYTGGDTEWVGPKTWNTAHCCKR